MSGNQLNISTSCIILLYKSYPPNELVHYDYECNHM